MTIPNFRQLQELELVVTWSSVSHQFLPSITSTELRKIFLLVRYMKDWTIFARQPEGRVFVDEQLCGVVYRLRAMVYRHTLKAELRLTDPGKYYFTIFFTRV